MGKQKEQKQKKENKVKKQKSQNKKSTTIGLLIFGLFILVISVIVIIKTMQVSKEEMSKASSKYTTIMSFDFENNYPTTPNKVMDNYCYIIAYLYSDEILDSEIPDVVRKSRELMHYKTIENTSEEQQIQSVLNERDIIRSTGSFVTNVSHSNVSIDTDFPNYADVAITEYTQSDNNLMGDYTLQMDDYKWKIYSWTLRGTSTSNGK